MPHGDATSEKVVARALSLFSQHGVAGTSLQMIADALGVSKAAVYHRFRTKSLIVEAVLAPAFAEIAELLESLRGRPAADIQAALVIGLARGAVAERDRYAVLLRDVTAAEALRASQEHRAVLRELRLGLTGGDRALAAQVRATVVLSGIVGPLFEPDFDELSDDELEAALIDCGRRTLGLCGDGVDQK